MKYLLFLLTSFLIIGFLGAFTNENKKGAFKEVTDSQINALSKEANEWKNTHNSPSIPKVHTIHQYISVRYSLDFKSDGVTVEDKDFSFATDFCNLSQKDDYPGFNNGFIPEYPYNDPAATTGWMFKDGVRKLPFFHFGLTDLGKDLIKRFQPDYTAYNEIAHKNIWTAVDDYEYNPYSAVLASHKEYRRIPGKPAYCRWHTKIGNNRLQQTCTRFGIGTFDALSSSTQLWVINQNIKLWVSGIELRGTREAVR